MAAVPTHKIELSKAARLALNEIRRYIAVQGAPMAAENTVARLLVAIESLAYFPTRGRSTGPRGRELTTVAPYIIRYRIAGSIVRVTRIRHSARRPD